LSYGIGSLLTLGRIGIDSTWLHEHLWIWYVLATLIGLAVLVQLVLPVIQVSVKYRDREFLEPKQFLPLRFFLPHSAMERHWFAVLSLTAGFTEELLFCGFLLRYFHSSPLHLPLAWAVAIAALIFGIHHLYQGRSGDFNDDHGADLYGDAAGNRQFVDGHGLSSSDRYEFASLLATQVRC
jgi:membrane protease YdiL (CAAX protease family)